MSIAEPGCPYFNWDVSYRKHESFPGGHETTRGSYRMFDISPHSPHEPWCLHFEWGPCSCAAEPDEVFVQNGTTIVPVNKGHRALYALIALRLLGLKQS